MTRTPTTPFVLFDQDSEGQVLFALDPTDIRNPAEAAADVAPVAADALIGADDSTEAEADEDDPADPDGGPVGPDFTTPVTEADDFPPSRRRAAGKP